MRKWLKIIWSWFIAPAFYYHEASHFIMIVLTKPFNTINWNHPDTHFKQYIKEDISLSLDWRVNIECTNLAGILIAIAPSIFWFPGWIYTLIYHPLIGVYFGLAVCEFWLSKGDIKALQECLSKQSRPDQ